MGTALRFTVVNRFPSFAAAHSHQILRGKLFCGAGLRKSFERCIGSQIRFQTTAWFLGPAGATGQLVHLAGFDSLKAAAKWNVRCCSSLQFYARERRGPLARGTLHPARFSKVRLLRSEWTTNRTRTSGDAKAMIVAIQIQRFVARRTYEATLDDVPGLFDDRHCHRLARAGPPRTTARS